MFQSTHPRRVWRWIRWRPGFFWMFQSTHPRRVWLNLLFKVFPKTLVSIHTPTKGVTQSKHRKYPRNQFQSTHPRRVWLFVYLKTKSLNRFQSTHPRRVWPAEPRAVHLVKCFNPHTHEGCDPKVSSNSDRKLVSIHTPTKGVTLHTNTVKFRDWFQSTHPRRVWHSHFCLP